MKKKHLWLLAIGLNLSILKVKAQLNPPPVAVTDIFAKMFPKATNVDWEEKTTNFTAFFNLNHRKCEAKFAKNGEWLNTEEAIQWDSLPQPVQDAFKTSKYANWKENSAYSIQTSDGTKQYHIVATSNDMGRKIFFFSQEGKLLTSR